MDKIVKMCIRDSSNTRIDFFIRKLPKPMYQGFEILDDCVCIAFLVIVCRLAYSLVGSNMKALSCLLYTSTKLMWLLGHNIAAEEVKERFLTPICNEIVPER